MTKISADIETDYRDAPAAGRRAIVEKLQRYIDRGLWAQSVMQALKAQDVTQPQGTARDAAESINELDQIPAVTDKPRS